MFGGETLAAAREPIIPKPNANQQLLAAVERVSANLSALTLLQDGDRILVPMARVDAMVVKECAGPVLWTKLMALGHRRKDHTHSALAALLYYITSMMHPDWYVELYTSGKYPIVRVAHHRYIILSSQA